MTGALPDRGATGLWLCLLAIALAFAAVGCEGRSVYSGKLVLAETHVFDHGDVIDGDLAMTGGMVVLQEGSLVSSSIYMLGGDLEISGEVIGDVTMLSGTLSVSDSARVQGELRIGGTGATVSPNATVEGGVQSLPVIGAPDLEGGPSMLSKLLRFLWIALGLALIAFLWVHILPRPAARVATAVTQHPLVVASAGLLAGVVGLMLLVLMAYTIILIPATLVGIVLLAIGALYGLIAVGLAVGRLVIARTKWEPGAAMTALVGTLVLVVALNLVGLVPIVGDLLTGAAVATGFGAVYLTRLGRWAYVPEQID